MESSELDQIVSDLLSLLKEKGVTFSEAVWIVNKLSAAVQSAGGGKAL